MHKNRTDRDKHEEMGFHDGWGTVTAQLAALVEGRAIVVKARQSAGGGGAVRT
jgi:hypothetical protein